MMNEVLTLSHPPPSSISWNTEDLKPNIVMHKYFVGQSLDSRQYTWVDVYKLLFTKLRKYWYQSTNNVKIGKTTIQGHLVKLKWMNTTHEAGCVPVLHIWFPSLQSHSWVFLVLTSVEVSLKPASWIFFAGWILNHYCFLNILSSSLHNFKVV